MDVTFSETEYFYTSVPSTSDHQGENNVVGNLSWLDIWGDVIIEQRVGPGIIGAECTKSTECVDNSDDSGDLTERIREPPLEARLASAEECPSAQQSIAEATTLVLAESNMLSLSSSNGTPNTSSLNIPEVSIVNDCVTDPSNNVSTYKLPPRQNRGVPPDRFSPEWKVKYSMANYVSCNKLAPERQTLVSNMESIQVPT
ncbi:hypothetical protein ACFX12_003711 [Malus domestica]